jgi:hypothetical protein
MLASSPGTNNAADQHFVRLYSLVACREISLCQPQLAHALNPLALEAIMMPMMTPKSPSALPKISTTRILTNRSGFCASERAQLEPATPTQMPHARFEKPTFTPAARSV